MLSLLVNLLIQLVCLLLSTGCLLIRHVNRPKDIRVALRDSYFGFSDTSCCADPFVLPQVPLLLLFGKHRVGFFCVGLNFFGRCILVKIHVLFNAVCRT